MVDNQHRIGVLLHQSTEDKIVYPIAFADALNASNLAIERIERFSRTIADDLVVYILVHRPNKNPSTAVVEAERLVLGNLQEQCSVLELSWDAGTGVIRNIVQSAE
jgi:hypothetical protein